MALAGGATVRDAAKSASVSERTAHRRLKDPLFNGRLHELRARNFERVESQLSVAAQWAVHHLLQLLHYSEDPKVRLAAARCILGNVPPHRESAAISRRLADLEAALGELKQSLEGHSASVERGFNGRSSEESRSGRDGAQEVRHQVDPEEASNNHRLAGAFDQQQE